MFCLQETKVQAPVPTSHSVVAIPEHQAQQGDPQKTKTNKNGNKISYSNYPIN